VASAPGSEGPSSASQVFINQSAQSNSLNKDSNYDAIISDSEISYSRKILLCLLEC